MEHNICKFSPKNENSNELNIINFVYETDSSNHGVLKHESLYKMHLVTAGNGVFALPGKRITLRAGDLFFTYPSMSYYFESDTEFKYMYISCIGSRINYLFDRLGIGAKALVFHGFEKLIPLWLDAITDDNAILDLRCEGILLYSFSALEEQEVKQKNESDSFLLIKKYIDDNFSDRALTLSSLGERFSYNDKYLSTAFKQHFQVGITQYITVLRIQQACTLMEQGFSSIGDIAYRCGFSDPLYFSKVFKKHMGISPKAHICAIKANLIEK